MGFITNTSSNISTQNSEDILTSPGFNAYSGNVVSCTSTTITIDSSANAIDDSYNNLLIEIVGGFGNGTRGIAAVRTNQFLGRFPAHTFHTTGKYKGHIF